MSGAAAIKKDEIMAAEAAHAASVMDDTPLTDPTAAANGDGGGANEAADQGAPLTATGRPAKRRKVVMIPSKAQINELRVANDLIFRLRCQEDLLVSVILEPSGTDSRVVAAKLGEFAVMMAHDYNIYTQRQMNHQDKLRGDTTVAVSNFLQRRIADTDVRAIELFFATMVKNNANDHISRTMRVAAIFVGLTMCIDFRTNLSPTPLHVGRFSQQLADSLSGASAAAASTTGGPAAAAATKQANEEKEQQRRDQLRGRKVDPEALSAFLMTDGAELMARLFDGAITLPEYAYACAERYLSYKPAAIPWIFRKYREAVAAQQ